jgi:hypothetical protein
MTTYKVSTEHKKSITEKNFYTKDGQTICYSIGWRWGYVRYEEKPDLSNYNPETDEIEIYELGDVVDHSYDDGCWADWEFPDNMDEEEKERIQEIYEEEYDEGLENEGWTLDKCEVWLSGPLLVEEEDDE